MPYQPDRYVNVIRFHGKEKIAFHPSLQEPYFATWKEAHEWLIAERERNVANLRAKLKNAERTLARARQMKEPTSALTA